ncbi:DEAD/DEAH box helicase [Paenibacillus harenae]|uniref:Superfamily II DNA or RNA helicase n=1 Tax=Paenibacillus harenae TaxID=306543 RepID=A0ABT9U2R7_PAEHA|nr:DEAD/DEAH box helicase [Paenibacillus harenae]MDQ0113926.1 superfamily II DNA or RNA helicase [Paenibacillus harenae]
MSFRLTKRIIKLLCGETSFARGEALQQEGKVALTSEDATASVHLYEAVVSGNNRYEITVNIDGNGDVDAECTCLAFYSSDKLCKHVAAVLLHIHEQQFGEDSPVHSYSYNLDTHDKQQPTFTDRSESRSSQRYKQQQIRAAEDDNRLVTGLLGLFGDRPARPTGAGALFDSRMQLEAEFTIKLHAYGNRKLMFGIELKAGPKRPYIVQRIRDFLNCVDRRKPYPFSKHFIYDPAIHCFRQEDDAVLQRLIRIYRNESLIRESALGLSGGNRTAGGDRMLLIPPASWEELLHALGQAPAATIEQDGRLYAGVTVTDEAIPLQFRFDQAETTTADSCLLEVQGLEQLAVMEDYGIVLSQGKLLKTASEQCHRLAELKQMLEQADKQQLTIASAQIEPFMEKVIPGLMKLGTVHISEAVSERIIRMPLRAKLYLDRIKDRLLIGMEFHYGRHIINPLNVESTKRASDRILMRDGEQERRIMSLMEQDSFGKTEGGYFIDDEDAQYEFLYHIVPELEKLAEIHATGAVKIRLFAEHAPPRVRIDVDERTDWLAFTFNIDGIPEGEIKGILKSLSEKRRYYRMPNGALMPLETEQFQEIIRLINELGFVSDELLGQYMRIPAVRGLRLADRQSQSDTVKLGKTLRQLLDNLRNPDNLEFTVPPTLAGILRDYQAYGYQWMRTLAHYRFGGILADDMGLGKTIQSIAFVVSMLPEIRSEGIPAIIVSPASLIYNWRNELHRFAPEVRLVIADGTKEERNDIVSHASSAARADVIITSYPLLRRDILQYADQTFHTLILDEAQAFKNYATQTAQAVKALQARHRFALTGTPVENGLEELWSIFDVVFPQLFPGRRQFGELQRETIARRIRPFLLRRLKRDVLGELPEKIESIQTSELLPEQKKLYVAYLAELRQDTVQHLNKDSFNKHRIRILAGITRLRQLCDHPALFVEGYQGSSAKLEQLLEIIEECRSAGKRMLIFSQFTQMLGIIARELADQGVSHFYLDGSTPAAERVELCSRFNAGERELFLLSLKAGGTGLNLTGADTVVLYDLWWNPAVEQQAADRVHRIGQRNVVQIIRLVTQGTIEDKMVDLQQRKLNLIDEVVQPGGEKELTSLTEQDVRELLMLEGPAV